MKDRLSESIIQNLNEENKYHYITGANDHEEIGAEYEYNSYSNTEVMYMLEDLVKYFTQAEEDAEHIIANATHDPGVYEKDLEMCRFCAEKAKEMLDKMNSTFE